MTFIKDLYDDEVRDGFFVQSDIKKIWNRQLELWQEVDRICREHEINYWAIGGTLLGAARHSGFIPWNTDMKLCMMRPDFNRFCALVDTELNSEIFEAGQKNFFYFPIYHSQTTWLRTTDLTNINEPQGLLIEIFPLDVVPDNTRESIVAVNGLNELLRAVYSFPELVEHVKNGGATVNDWSIIENLHAMEDPDKQAEFLNIFAEGIFDYSERVFDYSELIKSVGSKRIMTYSKSWFRETVYLPFESVELPSPVDYDKLLTACYGDWHKPICNKEDKLGKMYSADIPYKEYVQLINMEILLGTPDNEEEH